MNQMDQNGSRRIKMDQDGSRWIKMDQDGSRCIKMDQDESRWIKMDQNGSILDFSKMDQNGSNWINIGFLIIPESVQKIKVVISKGFLFRKGSNNSAIQQNAILTLGKPKGFFNKDLVNFKQFIVVIHTVEHLDKSFHIYTWYVKIFKLFLAWKNKQKLFSNFSCMFLNPSNFFQFEF